MRGSSRHRSSRPVRARGQGGAPRAAQRENRDSGLPEELAGLLETVIRAAGMDLESARIGTAGRRRVLRVVVDADGGVSLDGIAEISRELSARLDSAGAMGDGPYTLEVSSPGVDRPLTEPRHWRRAVGRLVKVALATAGPADSSGRAQPRGWPPVIEGRVVAADEHGVTVEIDGDRREFGYAELGPGRVRVEFGRPETEGAAKGLVAGGPAAGDAALQAALAGPGTGGRPDGH
jgi:ribosome maturation factor RimP